MSHGLQVQTSYTWGKSIDNSSATVNGDQFSNSIASLFWVRSKVDACGVDFQCRRTLVINALWQLPRINSLASRQMVGKRLGVGSYFQARTTASHLPPPLARMVTGGS